MKNCKKAALIAATAGALVALPTLGLATPTDDAVLDSSVYGAFDTIWVSIVALFQGSFGRIIAALVIIAGVVAGIRTGSMMAFLSGAGVGVLMFFAPAIIEGLQGEVATADVMLEMLKNTSPSL